MSLCVSVCVCVDGCVPIVYMGGYGIYIHMFACNTNECYVSDLCVSWCDGRRVMYICDMWVLKVSLAHGMQMCVCVVCV